MRAAITILVLALTTTIAAAPSTTPRVALPSLTSQSDDERVSLPVDALRIRTLIRGHLARTTYEVTFRNDLDRDLDGQFSFPLPPDAEVSGLGLYFDGHLRRAVAVERVQARAAYDEVVHRRVDPALAEWSASTRVFRFRVYPIPARGTKVVHIAYDQDLTNSQYELDLRYGLALSSFDLTIDGDAPVESEELPLRRSGSEWSARQRNATLQGVVRVARDPSEVALAAWSRSDRTWYYAASPRIRSTARPMPRASAVTLLYDVSSSAIHRDDEKLREFLRRFLALQSEGVRVTVVPFHVFVEPPFETDAHALEQRLRELPHAGATNLVSLLEQLPTIAQVTPADSRIMLVTDGMQTIGDSASLARAIDRLTRLGRPIMIVNASQSADDTTLARVAAATGGWAIDLTRDLDAAAAAMRLPTRIALTPSVPSIRRILPDAMTFTADITASIHARGSQRLSWFPVAIGASYRELPIRELSTVEDEDLVRRSWARASLRELLEHGAPAEEVLEHGLRFQQLTPQTSLLVLDTWQDYEAYGIPLPRELREQRARDIAEIEAEERRRNAPGSIVMRGIDAEAASRRTGWFIKGTVTEGQYALPGATVEMLVDGATTAAVITDAEGRFWITARRAPAQFVLRASLAGFNSATQSYPRGAPKGAVLDVMMHIAAISEQITVTAEAPWVVDGAQTITTNASLVQPTAEVLADGFEGIAGVVEQMQSLSSSEARFRLYIAARSAIGGQKFFQARAALAMHEDAPELAVRALTDLAESDPDDAPTLRLIGRVLDGWGFGDLARLLFERALELSPRETQTWRELLLLTAKDNPAALTDLQRRFSAAKRDERMEQTETALTAELQRRGNDRRIDEASELQVEVMWDTNYTDVDLRVVEPDGEEVSYSHRESKRGGKLHDDVMSGFGPETYTIPRMGDGTYEIALDYYGGDDTRVAMQALAHVIVYVRGVRSDYFVALAGEEERVVVAKITR